MTLAAPSSPPPFSSERPPPHAHRTHPPATANHLVRPLARSVIRAKFGYHSIEVRHVIWHRHFNAYSYPPDTSTHDFAWSKPVVAYKGIAKVQHYVPQFLLRNFGTGKKDQLYVFNKSTDKTFITSARNVAAESRFYDFEIDGVALTIEPALSRIEAAAKPIVKQLSESDSLVVLRPEDREMLSVFFAIQFVRTKATRAAVVDAEEQFREVLRRRGFDETQLAEAGFGPDEKMAAAMAIKMVIDAPKAYSRAFMEKQWVLVSAPAKDPFIIGDHPLAMQNVAPHEGPFGNIGLMVPGIEIYFPISPVRALAMWCPSTRDQIVEGAATIQALRQHAPHLLAQRVKNPEAILRMAHALQTGNILHYEREHIENFNWLQIVHAESFVFSSRDDFELTRRVVAQSNELRRGRRMQVG